MDDTKIRWADSSWNPMTGCDPVSPGCNNCYARAIAEKFRGSAFPQGFQPMYRLSRLNAPAGWKTPRRVFVNSMSDLFHRAFTPEQIDSVFAVMLREDRHTYQVLTKRPERMRHYLAGWLERQGLSQVPDHIWLGVSIELERFVYRADVLRSIPVPIRFISAEPLLGPLPSLSLAGINWLIVGGESGPKFRSMDPQWARDLRDRAVGVEVTFFFKQSSGRWPEKGITLDGVEWEQYPARNSMLKLTVS